jgi:hypothetical protein
LDCAENTDPPFPLASFDLLPRDRLAFDAIRQRVVLTRRVQGPGRVVINPPYPVVGIAVSSPTPSALAVGVQFDLRSSALKPDGTVWDPTYGVSRCRRATRIELDLPTAGRFEVAVTMVFARAVFPNFEEGANIVRLEFDRAGSPDPSVTVDLSLRTQVLR